MKRKKNFVLLVSVIVFLCVVLLGVNTAFSVTKIESEFSLFSDDAKKDARELQDVLENNYKGKLLFFVNTEKVAAHFDGYAYLTVTEVKKAYPNRILLTVTEKKEQYAFETESESGIVYYVTDSEGNLLRSGETNVNNADGGANFVISGLKKDAEKGFSADKNYDTVMKVCKILDERAGGIRTCLKSLKIETNPDSAKITVYTAEGVTVEIYNPANLLEKKANAAFDTYLSLSDVHKLYGRIVVTDDADDANGIKTTYSPRV